MRDTMLPSTGTSRLCGPADLTKREKKVIRAWADSVERESWETGRVELLWLARALRDLTWTECGSWGLTERIRWFASIDASGKPGTPRKSHNP